jgi:acetyltransferase-like isoleucine patch superfamily enzyme
MISKIKKIIDQKPSLGDLACYGYIKSQAWLSGFFGTLRLRFKALIFGVKLGEEVKCFGPIHISRFPFSEIRIGNNVHIVSSSPRATAASIFAPTKLRTHARSAKIIIEDDVGLNGTSIVARTRTVRIGKGTMIAANCAILDGDYHAFWPPENRIINPDFESDADVTIGKNVWVGGRCVILKGVEIGDNSVIAAGSIVTRNIPPDTVAAGSPARVLHPLPANDQKYKDNIVCKGRND